MYRERARSLRAGLGFVFHWRENGGVGESVPPQCEEVIESVRKESKKVLFPGANFRPWFRWWLRRRNEGEREGESAKINKIRPELNPAPALG